MKRTHHKEPHVPEHLLDWQGGYPDLVTQAQKVIDYLARHKSAERRASLVYEKVKKLNVRLLQHYVTSGIVGSGRKNAHNKRRALFGKQELLQVIVARLLVADGWSLPHVTDVVGRGTVDNLLELLSSFMAGPEDMPDRREQRAGTPMVAGLIRAPRQVLQSEEWLLFHVSPWSMLLIRADGLEDTTDELIDKYTKKVKEAITIARQRRRRPSYEPEQEE
jgi:hypothetical protein